MRAALGNVGGVSLIAVRLQISGHTTVDMAASQAGLSMRAGTFSRDAGSIGPQSPMASPDAGENARTRSTVSG